MDLIFGSLLFAFRCLDPARATLGGKVIPLYTWAHDMAPARPPPAILPRTTAGSDFGRWRRHPVTQTQHAVPLQPRDDGCAGEGAFGAHWLSHSVSPGCRSPREGQGRWRRDGDTDWVGRAGELGPRNWLATLIPSRRALPSGWEQGSTQLHSIHSAGGR